MHKAILFFLWLISPALVFAQRQPRVQLGPGIQSVGPGVRLGPGIQPVGGNVPPQVQAFIDRIANIAIGVIIAVAVLYIIYAGWVFLSSQGDPASISRGKQIVIYAVVGIAVALAARLAVEVAQFIFLF